VQFDIGKLGRPVDGDEEVELAFGGVDLSNINVKIADRIGLELLLRASGDNYAAHPACLK
jgi:hypothetical protein